MRFVRCANCQRERHAEDVFWHEGDSAHYCVDVEACEIRFDALDRRGLIDHDDRERAGQT